MSPSGLGNSNRTKGFCEVANLGDHKVLEVGKNNVQAEGNSSVDAVHLNQTGLYMGSEPVAAIAGTTILL